MDIVDEFKEIQEWDEISVSPVKQICLNSSQLVKKRRLVFNTPFSNFNIISYGFIVYAKDTKKSIIVQRKHSADFLIIMRGLYRLTHLSLILSRITIKEANIILECIHSGPSGFKNIYLSTLGLPKDGLSYALIRMAEMKDYIMLSLPELDLSNNHLNWNWPKGRLNMFPIKESPFECAKREFMEEVEVILPEPTYISTSYITENIRTITGRNIESRYWVYVIPNEIPILSPQNHPEVINRIWATTDEHKKYLSCKNLFQQVDDILAEI